MTRPLQPGDRIAKYRIVGPLGSGGMGEVYLAQDLSLERSVAIKVLPPELVQSEDRVRRFVQEARTASSLNHPNIVTIYEIGHDVVHPSGSDATPDESKIHFISMELVAGRTLAALIHDERTDLRTLLGYVAQAAEGLAKAHGAGIVHRDLKPGNIMVSSDGFTKVLDFGLAKLIEHRDPDPGVTNAATVPHDATLEGRIMGTVGYMAPEQVKGKPVDHRADIFALGCILYEAATRHRPFEAESSVEVMHKILHDTPSPVETLNTEVPSELRRLIRRALAKNPEQRLQSMKDLALELREIVDEYDSLAASTTSATRYPRDAAAVVTRPRGIPKRFRLVIGLAAVFAATAVVWGILKERGSEGTAAPLFRMSSLTNRGDINECVISRDGRYLAYLTSISGVSSIHVLQVATGSDVEVTATQDDHLDGLSFSPDGNFLWYLMRRKDAPNYRYLLQVASLGGASRERAFDVDSRVSFSPDGTHIAFKRGMPHENQEELIVRELETGDERTVYASQHPNVLNAVAWSRDGKRLAALEWGQSQSGVKTRIILVPHTGGKEDVLSEHRASRLESIDWLPDGSGVVVSGPDIGLSVTSQIQLVTVPRGQRIPLTNDVSEYEGVSVAADGSISATRQIRFGDIWVADTESGALHQVLAVSNPDRAPFEVVCADSQSVHYAGMFENEIHLFSVPITGGEPRVLTPPGQMVIQVDAYVGGLVLRRVDPKEPIPHIWKINAEGSALRQITHGGGEEIADVTRDGRTLLYTRADSAGYWLVTEGAEPQLVGGDSRYRYGGQLSPEGSFLGVYQLVPEGDLMRPQVHVFSVSDGKELFAYAGSPNVFMPRWTHVPYLYYFVNRRDPSWNLYRVQLPAREELQVTRFDEGRVQYYALSPDGQRIALVLRKDDGENVWVTDFDGGHPQQITHFTSKNVLSLDWNPDSRRVVIYAGQAGRDAVIMKRPEKV